MKKINITGNLKKRFKNLFSNDIGIDLGTANTLVYVRGRGIVLNEPTVVALNEKTGRVVAVGSQAQKMIGRTPSHITAIRPLVDGVISDFEITEEMIAYLINKSQENVKKLIGPRVLVGVPSGITNVETRAVRDAVKNSGAKEVHLIEEPMVAAIGNRLPIKDAIGSVVIDIGGGTTDIAVISLGGIVNSKNLRIAGDRFNEDIIQYVRNKFKILIGEKTAERLKIDIGSVLPLDEPLEATMRGRDLVTGLPREIKINDTHIRKAISQSLVLLLDGIKEVLEITPPEIVSDILNRGIFITGGGAMIKQLDTLISEVVKVPVYIADDPLTSVARGTGIVLEDLLDYREVLIQDEDGIPLKE
ncbi:MAG: rod shape-determining protein [Patescibacteria group bacterium]|nr:rod shape-determining protein [Patescibacteria group bacterium]